MIYFTLKELFESARQCHIKRRPQLLPYQIKDLKEVLLDHEEQ